MHHLESSCEIPDLPAYKVPPSEWRRFSSPATRKIVSLGHVAFSCFTVARLSRDALARPHLAAGPLQLLSNGFPVRRKRWQLGRKATHSNSRATRAVKGYVAAASAQLHRPKSAQLQPPFRVPRLANRLPLTRRTGRFLPRRFDLSERPSRSRRSIEPRGQSNRHT